MTSNIIFKTDLHCVTVDGITWQCWRQWDFFWGFCWPGYEMIYCDQPHYLWKFGVISLCVYYHSTYHETHGNSPIL